jgi:hypothetical protein
MTKIGETFGLVLAEAMILGKPVVSQSTPLHGNSQVELIDHGVNGYVVYTQNAFIEATIDLLLNKQKYQQMSLKASEKIKSLYEAQKLTLQLESLYIKLLQNKGYNIAPLVLEKYNKLVYEPSSQEMKNFENEYKNRVRRCWGKPNWLEILGYEYIFRFHKPNKFVRKMKSFI